MSLDNIKPIAIELGETITKIKALEAKKKLLEAQVRPVLASVGTVQFESHQFTITEHAGRKSLDKAAMIADGLDVESYTKVGAPYTKMAYKRVEII